MNTAVNGTITVSDGTATVAVTGNLAAGVVLTYDIRIFKGLTIVTTGTLDITVTYGPAAA